MIKNFLEKKKFVRGKRMTDNKFCLQDKSREKNPSFNA